MASGRYWDREDQAGLPYRLTEHYNFFFFLLYKKKVRKKEQAKGVWDTNIYIFLAE